MNIFVLDKDPIKAAEMHCNKHIVKMPLEVAQMLCSAFNQGDAPYRRTHYNHPCSKWARESKQNYLWLIQHGYALCVEYTARYNKHHKSEDIIKWCALNIDKLNLPDIGLTEFAKAMPDECKVSNVVLSYRKYYLMYKKDFAVWPAGKTPEWWSFSPAPLT
jgi:hypothetical protein